MQTGIDRTAMTSSSELVVVDSGVESQEWRVDFARIYTARERCTSVEAARVASILCESLCLLAPLEAVGIVMADGDLLAALRIATHDAAEDSRSADPVAMGFPAVARRA